MPNFKRIEEIEEWFNNFDHGENIENYPHTYDIFRPEEIIFLDLITIIGMARNNVLYAYCAYFHNHYHFGDLCNLAWNKLKLDLRLLPNPKPENLVELQIMFPNIEDIIFSSKLHENILNSIKIFNGLSFFIEDNSRIFRTNTTHCLEKLSITGTGRNFLSDPTIDILLSFPNVEELRLEDISLSPTILCALNNMTFNSISLRRTNTVVNYENKILEAIFKNKSKLKKLEIIAQPDNYLLGNMIKSLLPKLCAFPRLRKLSVSIELTRSNLLYLKRIPGIRRIQIVELPSDNYIRYNDAYSIFKSRRKLKLDILPLRDHNHITTFLKRE